MSFQEFRNTGRLGCPYDYEVFRDELMPLLENIHEETRHSGKVPKRAPRNSQQQTTLIQLRNDLKPWPILRSFSISRFMASVGPAEAPVRWWAMISAAQAARVRPRRRTSSTWLTCLALGDAGDLDRGVVLAVAPRPALVRLVLVREPADLRALGPADHASRDRGAG